MKRLILFACATTALCCASCSKEGGSSADDNSSAYSYGSFTLKDVAVMMSALPLQNDQLCEVYDAVNSSSGNGYDEEYMMRDLLECPGAGVGDDVSTKASSSYSTPLKDLISDYLAAKHPSTKASGADVQAYLDELASSEMQIYWPYSENWDGETFPIITYDPGYGATSNVGYEVSYTDDGLKVVDSVYVDENVAASRPVWVINRNDDSGFTPLEMYVSTKSTPAIAAKDEDEEDDEDEEYRDLYMKTFTMLRNYDSWFAGGSEFFVKCGAVSGFKASKEEDIKLYTPTVTDLMINVKRSEVGKELKYDAVLVTDFSSALDKLAFLVIEDDGGTHTFWKCSTTVKYKGKAYGFDIEIPLNSKDDIVWRGQLSASYFTKSPIVTGRFGDVIISFALE